MLDNMIIIEMLLKILWPHVHEYKEELLKGCAGGGGRRPMGNR
jgi:hypothetical protein